MVDLITIITACFTDTIAAIYNTPIRHYIAATPYLPAPLLRFHVCIDTADTNTPRHYRRHANIIYAADFRHLRHD